MMKDSAVGKQVFVLPLGTEMLTYVNPKVLENQASRKNVFLVCDTGTTGLKPLHLGYS